MVHYRVHRDPKSSHQQISKLVRELRLNPVLDVGCAQGMLAHMVAGNGLVLDGVQLSWRGSRAVAGQTGAGVKCAAAVCRLDELCFLLVV